MKISFQLQKTKTQYVCKGECVTRELREDGETETELVHVALFSTYFLAHKRSIEANKRLAYRNENGSDETKEWRSFEKNVMINPTRAEMTK